MTKRELKDKFIEAYNKADMSTPINWFWLRGATKKQVIEEAKELELDLEERVDCLIKARQTK